MLRLLLLSPPWESHVFAEEPLSVTLAVRYQLCRGRASRIPSGTVLNIVARSVTHLGPRQIVIST